MATYGIDNSCDNYNFTQYAAWYNAGLDTTCAIGIAKFGTGDGTCPATHLVFNIAKASRLSDRYISLSASITGILISKRSHINRL